MHQLQMISNILANIYGVISELSYFLSLLAFFFSSFYTGCYNIHWGWLPWGLPPGCRAFSLPYPPCTCPTQLGFWLLCSPSAWDSIPSPQVSAGHFTCHGPHCPCTVLLQRLPVQSLLLSPATLGSRASVCLASCGYTCNSEWDACFGDYFPSPLIMEAPPWPLPPSLWQLTADPSLPWLRVVWRHWPIFWGSAGVSLSPSSWCLYFYVLHDPILFICVSESTLGRFKAHWGYDSTPQSDRLLNVHEMDYALQPF